MKLQHHLSLLAYRCCSSSPKGNTNYCTQDPSIHLSTLPSCRLDEAPAGWTGPYSCLGEYCIYANRDYSNGRGMVVITTTQDLSIVKDIEPAERSGEGLFHVEKIPGKDLGVVADRRLNRGDDVMSRSPVFLAHKTFLEKPSEKQQNLLDQAVNHLPSRTRRLFLNQMGHFGGHGVSDILFTNTFQLRLQGLHYGNYPEISRFNHDCRPNVAFYIDSNLTHRTTVVREILPGKELSIAYLDPFELRASRHQRALSSWGFGCTCEQCSHTSEVSDGRLGRIHELEKMLEDPTTEVTMDKVYKWVDLHRQERLEVKLAGALTLAALNANLLGRADETRKLSLIHI